MKRVRTNFPVADVRPVIEEFDNNGQVVRRYNLGGEPRGMFFTTPMLFRKGDTLTIEHKPLVTTSVFRRNTVKTIDIWDVTQV